MRLTACLVAALLCSPVVAAERKSKTAANASAKTPAQSPLDDAAINGTTAGQRKQSPTDAYVRGLVARSRAITSGRLSFTMTSGFAGNEASIWRVDYKYSFSDGDWIRRFPKSPNVRLSCHGRLLTFHETPEPDSSIHRALSIQAPVSLAVDDPSSLALQTGTIWDDTTVEFIQKHQSDCSLVEHTTLEGVPVAILQWKVAKPDIYRAFGKANHLLHAGGFLRLYVAESLGYAIPRIEFTSREGAVACRITSTEFKEHSPGSFLPKSSRCQWFSPKPAYYMDFSLQAVELINQEIPPEDFEFLVPAGTQVHDVRDRSMLKQFGLSTATSSDDL